MKRFFTPLCFIIVAFMTLTFVSCGDDFPDEGYFKIGNTHYNINEASLQDVGYDSESDLYQLRLTMDNTSHNDFHSINVIFYSEVNTYLPSATYTPYLYDNDFEHKFKRGAWLVGDQEGGVFLSGNIKVTKSDEKYIIHLNCKDTNNNDVVAEYEGKIKVRI
ncbi:MAG: hypothetical protein IJZ87_01065 [Bacteroidales bacterium]|nr:hypothetical protein [Bacteroidales bacterium]